MSRRVASTVSRAAASTGAMAASRLISSAMPSRSPACALASVSVVLSWLPAGTMGETTTERSFSPALPSTNSAVSPTVPVTDPPARVTRPASASTSAGSASGVVNSTTDLPASASRTMRPDIAVMKPSAAVSRRSIWLVWSGLSSRTIGAGSTRAPSTTPRARARNTAAADSR